MSGAVAAALGVVALALVFQTLLRGISTITFDVLFLSSTMIGVGALASVGQTLIAADLLVCGLALALGARRVLLRTSSAPPGIAPLVAWPIGVGALGLLFIAGSTNRHETIVQVGSFLVLGLFAVVGRRIDPTRVDITSAIKLTFAVHGAVAMVQLFGVAGSRVTGAFLLPNQFGMFLVFLAPVMLDRAWKAQKSGAVLAFVMVIPLLIATGSRSSLAAGLVTAAAYAVLVGRRRGQTRVSGKRVIVAVFILVLVTPVAARSASLALEQWRYGGHLSVFAREEARGDRPLAFHESNWRDGWRAFTSSPVIGSALNPRLSPDATETFEIHDNYVAMIGELGLFGFGMLFLLLFYLARAWRRARGRSDLQALVLGIAGVLLVSGVFNLSFRQRFVWIAVGFLETALASARKGARDVPVVHDPSPSPSPR